MIVLLAIGVASAQDGGFDAHGFRLAGHDSDSRDPLMWLRPGDQEAGDVYVGALAEYANRPLVFEPQPGERVVALSDLMAFNVAAGVAPIPALRFDASLPVYVSSQSELEANAPAVGDLRLSAMVVPLRVAASGAVGLGLVGALDLPLGPAEDYLGSGALAGLVATTGTVEVDAYTASWTLGARLAQSTATDVRPAPTRGGSTMQAGVSVGAEVAEHTGVTLESIVDVPIDPVVATAIGVPAQAIASVRYVLPSGATLTAGVGAGIGLGAGASPIRLLVGGGFGTSQAGGGDLDGDGFVDSVDRCPDVPETVNQLDDEDGCPDELPWATVRAVVDGQLASDAVLSIERPDGREDPGNGEIKLPVLPGATYRVTGSLGSCLRVQTEVVASEAGGTIDVELLPVLGTVTVTVTDSIGTPVEGAVVRYLIDDPWCQATDRDLDGGRGHHQMGIGRHLVYVTADGYDVFEATFELRQGETETLDARLNPIR